MNALNRVRCTLEGLSVGDAFGERFFGSPDLAERLIGERRLPDHPPDEKTDSGCTFWPYTDDTQMALSVARCLARFSVIDQDWLAVDFALRYDSARGYGPSMHRYLARIGGGEDWRVLAPGLFEGQGSHGNGAAMRVAPVGAYFAGDMDAIMTQATLSAEVTHSHPEAISGAIAVAVAAAIAHLYRSDGILPAPADFLDRVQASVPDSEVRSGIRKARDFGDRTSVRHAVAVLGNGTGLSAQDTVPFALWCAARHLGDYEAALWLTVSGLGDRDTTCAIAGGIIAGYTGTEGIPAEWLRRREPLPEFA